MNYSGATARIGASWIDLDKKFWYTIDARNFGSGVSVGPGRFGFVRFNLLNSNFVPILFKVIFPLLHHFTVLDQENAQNMTRYYTVEQSKNTKGKPSNKMAGQNDPNLMEK